MRTVLRGAKHLVDQRPIYEIQSLLLQLLCIRLLLTIILHLLSPSDLPPRSAEEGVNSLSPFSRRPEANRVALLVSRSRSLELRLLSILRRTD